MSIKKIYYNDSFELSFHNNGENRIYFEIQSIEDEVQYGWITLDKKDVTCLIQDLQNLLNELEDE